MKNITYKVTLLIVLCSLCTVDLVAQLKVRATVYQPTRSQTDDTPLITADGSKIDLNLLNRGYIRWIAISPDLLDMGYEMGDVVYIEGVGRRTGIYEIHDLMNERHRLSVDILICLHCKPDLWREAFLYETMH